MLLIQKALKKVSHLSVKNSARLDRVVGITEHESLRNIVLLNTLQFDANVLTAFDAGHLNLVRPELEIIGKIF